MLNISIAYSQEGHLRGSVVDGKTNLPIAEATISISAKGLFYPADNKGKFNINNDQLSKTDSISISCIGYQTIKLKIGDMKPNGIIPLIQMVNILQEVKVGASAPLLIKVGSKEKNSGQMLQEQKPGLDRAMFMYGSKNVKGVIQSVGFYLSNGSGNLEGGDVTTPFRIRLFEVDTNGMPGREISKDIIIVSAKRNKAWFDVDISAYHIQNPDSGFFAAFSLLSYEYYQLKKGTETNDESGKHYEFGANEPADVITPRLGISWHRNVQLRSYFSVARSLENPEWHWVKDYFDQNYMIRAAIAPE